MLQTHHHQKVTFQFFISFLQAPVVLFMLVCHPATVVEMEYPDYIYSSDLEYDYHS